MKLLSAHIVNYGKLSDVSISFKDGLNSFCEQNGYGKSTIVSFIKAMFYGLAGYKSNSGFVERKHFYPFGGGTFGGNIEFEYAGKSYRIERTFGEKSTTNDKLAVYCGSNPTDELGDVPGVRVFGINCDSFERLLCINAEKITISSSNDMNKKLNNYIHDVNEDFDIDNVLGQIKKTAKNKKDEIKVLESSVKKLNSEINNLEHEKTALDDKYAVLNTAKTERDKAKADYIKAASFAAVAAKWQDLDSRTAGCLELEKGIGEIKSRYKNGIPDLNDSLKIKEICDQKKSEEAQLKNSDISPDDLSQYNNLKEKFKNASPSQQELDNLRSLIDDLQIARQKYAQIESDEPDPDEKRLEEHFNSRPVDQEYLQSLEQYKQQLDVLEQQLKGINKTIVVTTPKAVKPQANNKLPAALLVLALLMILSGVGVLFVSLPVGVILIVVGILLVTGDMFIYLNNKNKRFYEKMDEPEERDNPEYIEKNAQVNELRNKMLNELAFYRYKDKDPVELFFDLKSDAKQYNMILNRKNSAKQQLESVKQEAKQTIGKLDAAFAKYGISSDDYSKELDKLKGDVTRYNMLEKQITKNKDDKNKLTGSIRQKDEQISAFYSKYCIPPQLDINSVIEDIREAQRLDAELRKRTDEINKFKADNKLSKRPEMVDYDLDELKAEEERKSTEFRKIDEEVDKLENSVSALDDKKNTLEETMEKLGEAKAKIKLLERVKNEIVNADQRLKDRYIAPVKDKFSTYAKLINDAVGDNIKMDKDFRVSYDRFGELRSYEHLSDGNLSVCALCFRLAIMDNMFDDELPFIIMDDPFVHLDEKNFASTAKLLKDLCVNKQIIYFCCHESRNIK